MFLRAFVVAMVLVAVLPTASHAGCRTISIPGPGAGEFRVVEICDGEGVPVPDVPAPGDHDVDAPGVPVRGGPPAVTCTQGLPVNDIGGVMGEPPTPRADGSLWGDWYFNCSDGTTEIRQVCGSGCAAADPAAPVAPVVRFRSIPDLRLEAIGKVSPPLPGVRHSFDQVAHSGEVRAVVLAEQWWWSEAPIEPITARAEDGPVWVEVTATPGAMTIDTGDGTGDLTCDLPGVVYDFNVSYYDQVPGEPEGACVHVYEAVSDAMTATMSMTWEIDWEGSTPSGGPVSGSLDPIVRSETVTFPVREIQSVIVANPD